MRSVQILLVMLWQPVDHLQHESWSWQRPTAGCTVREAACGDGFSSGYSPQFIPGIMWDSAFRAKGLCFSHGFNGWALIIDHKFLQNAANSSSFMSDCPMAPGDALSTLLGELLSCWMMGREGFLSPRTGLSSCTCPASWPSCWGGARKASLAPQAFCHVLGLLS